MLNKLNISGIIGVFSFLEVYSFSLRLHIEFDKNANSSYVSVVYTFRISLLSDKSGFAFFVRNFGCALFNFGGTYYEKNSMVINAHCSNFGSHAFRL